MSKVLKDAKEWLKEADESACFCEIGETANGQPYHTLECVKTSAHIIRKLVEALELAEQASRPTKRAADVLCTCGATPVVGGAEVCLFCGLPKVAHR